MQEAESAHGEGEGVGGLARVQEGGGLVEEGGGVHGGFGAGGLSGVEEGFAFAALAAFFCRAGGSELGHRRMLKPMMRCL